MIEFLECVLRHAFLFVQTDGSLVYYGYGPVTFSGDNRMGNLVWCTDIHLDMVDEARLDQFVQDIQSAADRDDASRLLITGDISTGNKAPVHINKIAGGLNIPVDFVMGNHDYYGCNIEWTREIMTMMSYGNDNITYLPTTNFVSLSDKTALVGHDGWYDAYHGSYADSNLIMNDWLKISNFQFGGAIRGHRVDYASVIKLARELAAGAVKHIVSSVEKAVVDHRNIIVATHFPPFAEAHTPRGRKSSPEHLPWYTSKLMGDALLALAEKHKGHKFDVYCGHVHEKNDVVITSNLSCHVGGASYENPGVAGIIHFD